VILNEFQMDALRELGNIGAAHAADTLSQMLMCKVEMRVPVVEIYDIGGIHHGIGEDVGGMVIFKIEGELENSGFVVVYFPIRSVIMLTNRMLGQTGTDRQLDEMDQSVLVEVGNIMVSSFLDATAQFLGTVMLPSPPDVSIDMALASFEALLSQVAMDINDVVIFRTELVTDDTSVEGSIFMLPEAPLLSKLVEMLECMV